MIVDGDSDWTVLDPVADDTEPIAPIGSHGEDFGGSVGFLPGFVDHRVDGTFALTQ